MGKRPTAQIWCDIVLWGFLVLRRILIGGLHFSASPKHTTFYFTRPTFLQLLPISHATVLWRKKFGRFFHPKCPPRKSMGNSKCIYCTFWLTRLFATLQHIFKTSLFLKRSDFLANFFKRAKLSCFNSAPNF